MFQHRKKMEIRLLPSIIALAIALVFGDASRTGFAQQKQEDMPMSASFSKAISSEAFMNVLPRGSLQTASEPKPFPNAISTKETAKAAPTQSATQAAYSVDNANLQTGAVATAQYQSPASATPIGSGVAVEQPFISQTTATPAIPEMQLVTNPVGWRKRLGLDNSQPNFLVGYEAISFHRSNDSVGPFSQNAPMQYFDREMTGRFTVSKLFGGLERIDFIFTGPFHFEKQNSVSGPVNSNLPGTISSGFDAADRHQQSHSIKLSSYELNRCSSGDDLSQFFYGLRFLEHNERYMLDSTKGLAGSHFRIESENFMAGGQIGLDLFRPVSQRFSVGFGSSVGVYGNFATAAVSASDGANSILDASDSGFRINSMFGGNGRLKYQVSKNIVASGGYELWYFPGLATAADQRLPSGPQPASFSLQSDDDQLFRGWSAGLSGRF